MVPGFFGKVPARGDFLARRVPPSVAPAWEAWLQAITAAVRDDGRPGWQDAWLTAPLWHFALGRDLAGPHGAAGILIASADRVGRLFPFTLIAAAAPDGAAWSEWSDQAETLALTALEDTFDPNAFDAQVATLGPPRVGETDRSTWWTRGSDRVEARQWSRPGLPSAAEACAMLLGS